MSAQSHDPAGIGTLYQQLLENWNRRDAVAFAALFAEDASVVGFDGSQMNGRAEIATEIGQIFADHPTSRYVGKIREVRQLAPETADKYGPVGVLPTLIWNSAAASSSACGPTACASCAK